MTENCQDKVQHLTDLYTKHVEMVYRICLMLLKNKSDAEDAVQVIFTKVLEKEVMFQNEDHERAWLIVAAKNHCKNELKHWWKKRIGLDEIPEGIALEKEDRVLLDLVIALPEKYKLPLYLYYYEGYSTDEVAKILAINPSTLRSRLKKGREQLKMTIGGSYGE